MNIRYTTFILPVQITSARSHSDKNKRILYKKEFESYKNNKLYYVSFQGIKKLGINPKPRAYDTPIGVYTFPVNYIYTKQFNDTISVDIQEQPYVFLLKRICSDKKVLFLDRNISDSEFSSKLEKLKDVAREKYSGKRYFDEYILQEGLDNPDYKDYKVEDRVVKSKITNSAELYLFACFLSFPEIKTLHFFC